MAPELPLATNKDVASYIHRLLWNPISPFRCNIFHWTHLECSIKQTFDVWKFSCQETTKASDSEDCVLANTKVFCFHHSWADDSQADSKPSSMSHPGGTHERSPWFLETPCGSLVNHKQTNFNHKAQFMTEAHPSLFGAQGRQYYY